MTAADESWNSSTLPEDRVEKGAETRTYLRIRCPLLSFRCCRQGIWWITANLGVLISEVVDAADGDDAAVDHRGTESWSATLASIDSLIVIDGEWGLYVVL